MGDAVGGGGGRGGDWRRLPYFWRRQDATPKLSVERGAQCAVAAGVLRRWRLCCAFAVAAALDQHPIVGPDPASWFRRIGWDVTYGVPLAMIALGLVGHAIRDRSSGLAFSAGLLANVVATIVVLMRLARERRRARCGGVGHSGPGECDRGGSVGAGLVGGGTHCRGKAEPVARAGAVGDARRAGGSAVRHVPVAGGSCGWRTCLRALSLGGAGGRRTGWIRSRWPQLRRAGWMARPHSRVGRRVFRRAAGRDGGAYSLRWDSGDWLAFHTLLGGLVAAAWGLPLVTAA